MIEAFRVIASIFVLIFLLQSVHANENFPVSPAAKVRIDFWKRIYSEIDGTEGLIHDPWDLSIVYKKVQIGNIPYHKISDKARELKEEVQKVLIAIVEKNGENLTEEEQQYYDLLKRPPLSQIVEKANALRFQQGQKDKFYKGLVLSGRWIVLIKKAMVEAGLPIELAYLPHVESSFNHDAYSKVGAAGIWQFMRSSARSFRLKMDAQFDERRDPLKSTKAAINHLIDNYRQLGTWPLAVTAYNHGVNSMKRAVIATGSTDFQTITDQYQNSRFGFASKNFYPSFLAAVEVAENPEKYFGKIKMEPPWDFIEVALPSAKYLNDLVAEYTIKREDLLYYNLSVRKIKQKHNILFPKGFMLRLPRVYEKSPTMRKPIIASALVNNEILPTPWIPKKTKNEKNTVSINRRRDLDLSPIEFYSFLMISTRYQLKLDPLAQDFYYLTVESDETMQSYADWSGLGLNYLLRINGVSSKHLLKLGDKIKIRLVGGDLAGFKYQRQDYHYQLEEDFYSSFRTSGSFVVNIYSGFSWEGLSAKYMVPIWLLRQYQTSKNFNIFFGQAINIPLIQSIEDSSAPNLIPSL